MTQPLVSCIMPTADRRRYVPHAIDYFLRQDYAERELVILDDGQDAVADLVPADPRIRYLRESRRRTVGAKRNACVEAARGEIIVHWDDDDWQAPHRLSRQVEALLRSGADLCGCDALWFLDPTRSAAWIYRYPGGDAAWVCGTSMCYRRALWRRNRFPEVRVGEDSRFIAAANGVKVARLGDLGLIVALVHPRNTSLRRTQGRCWQSIPIEQVRERLGDDWPRYAGAQLDARPRQHLAPAHRISARAPGRPGVASALTAQPAPQERVPAATVSPVRNVFACLVHEAQDCVVDLVRNLRHLDPSSVVLLYNGGNDPALLQRGFPFARLGAVIHPEPRPMKWGALHGFALDCMRFATRTLSFDTLTIVDSDQLAVRAGYSERLATFLAGQDKVGMLCNSPGVQGRATQVGPAIAAWKEFELWRGFLRRFPDGEAKWPHWSFWPTTVLTAEACRALVDVFNDAELRRILARSKLWATEEILFPTLTSLLGYRVLQNPCSDDYVQYRKAYSELHLKAALARRDVYWMHPVPRRSDSPLRQQIRQYFDHYRRSKDMHPDRASSDFFLTLPLLAQMKLIEGWLEEDEADLLIATVRAACGPGQGPRAIVEIGSYCGRSTVVLASAARAFADDARVHAIDPHDGKVGAADQHVSTVPCSFERFEQNIRAAGVAHIVKPVRKHSWEVEWQDPIGLLFVDGLHDYANVARDFGHFEPALPPGGYVAFHDYADYYPGVVAFVDELLASGEFELVQLVRSLVVLRRLPRPA